MEVVVTDWTIQIIRLCVHPASEAFLAQSVQTGQRFWLRELREWFKTYRANGESPQTVESIESEHSSRPFFLK